MSGRKRYETKELRGMQFSIIFLSMISNYILRLKLVLIIIRIKVIESFPSFFLKKKKRNKSETSFRRFQTISRAIMNFFLKSIVHWFIVIFFTKLLWVDWLYDIMILCDLDKEREKKREEEKNCHMLYTISIIKLSIYRTCIRIYV